MTMETRMTRCVVLPVGEPIFSERATEIKIIDEGAGEFVVISQNAPDHGWTGKVAIEVESWSATRNAIEMMVKGCRESKDD